nr:hypothetical protein [Micromonospora sp. DSM 115978]
MSGKVTVVGAGFYGSTTAQRLAEYDVVDDGRVDAGPGYCLGHGLRPELEGIDVHQGTLESRTDRRPGGRDDHRFMHRQRRSSDETVAPSALWAPNGATDLPPPCGHRSRDMVSMDMVQAQPDSPLHKVTHVTNFDVEVKTLLRGRYRTPLKIETVGNSAADSASTVTRTARRR